MAESAVLISLLAGLLAGVVCGFLLAAVLVGKQSAQIGKAMLDVLVDLKTKDVLKSALPKTAKGEKHAD